MLNATFKNNSVISWLFYWWRTQEYPEKITDLTQVTDKTNVVSSTPHHEEMAFWWDWPLWGGQNIWWNKKRKIFSNWGKFCHFDYTTDKLFGEVHFVCPIFTYPIHVCILHIYLYQVSLWLGFNFILFCHHSQFQSDRCYYFKEVYHQYWYLSFRRSNVVPFNL